MTCYSVQPRWNIWERLLIFCLLLEMGKSIGENVNSKYSQRLLDPAKQSIIDDLRLI